MNRRLVERALVKYGVAFIRIFEPETGYRNKSFRIKTTTNEDLNLIFYKFEPEILAKIKAADQVSEYAAARGLPTRTRADCRTLRMTSTSGREYYARLYRYLPGVTIPWEAYTKNHVKLLGTAMSDLHAAVADLCADLPDTTTQLSQLTNQMERYFMASSVKSAMAQKLDLRVNPDIFRIFRLTIAATAGLIDQIPLHLDLVRSNLLYGADLSPWRIDNLSLTGLIDFEKTARGHVVLDLARTYAFLWVDCARKSPEKLYKYLIHSGYNKRGANQFNIRSQNLNQIFWRLVNLYLFHDFYKFLRHNPYEYLAENQHFVRTRDILLSKNMLR